MNLQRRYGGNDAQIGGVSNSPISGFLSNIWDRLTGRDSNQELENEAFIRLGLRGDKWAARDPRFEAGIMLAGDPTKQLPANWLQNLKLKANPNSRVGYTGGGSGTNFVSEMADRGASYMDNMGGLKAVYNIPDEVWKSGQKTAAKLGQPTRYDSFLPNEWMKKAVPVKNAKPPTFEIGEVGDLDSFLRSMKF